MQPIIVDGLNVAYWCGAPPSLRLPLCVMLGLFELRLPAHMVFDASAPYQLPDTERDLYAELVQYPACCLQVPSGQDADAHMLRQARQTQACIVTRDQFRDHRKQYRNLIRTPGRLQAGYIEQDVLHIPTLGLTAPLADSPHQAWRQLRAQLPAAPPRLSA